MTNCPVCDSKLKKFEQKEKGDYCDCPRCGPYVLSGSAQAIIAGEINKTPNGRSKLSRALYQMTKREKWAFISSYLLTDILENTELPRPQEQLENLILWLGECQPNLGATIDPDEAAISAVGTIDFASFDFLVEQGISAGLLDGNVSKMYGAPFSQANSLQLTLSGWQLFEELQRGKSDSRIAFMAMQFGDEELDKIYKDYFKFGVADTGFDLKRVDEGQPAGLIDDYLRVEIRQCRFLIADLTHQNNGAYWEAGYAEGLGKPVIYTCRKDIFEKAQGTHFDTNHHLTVLWEFDKIGDAVKRLKDTIRATLPGEAILSDLKYDNAAIQG